MCLFYLYTIYDWITIIVQSRHALGTIKFFYSPKKIVILHPCLPITATSRQRPLSSEPKVAVLEKFDCIARSLLCNLLQINHGGRGGVDGTPPRSFWYVAVFWNAFTFSGKPLIFLTRLGIFKGWWLCWRPVTSPTMVAILDFTKNKKSG